MENLNQIPVLPANIGTEHLSTNLEHISHPILRGSFPRLENITAGFLTTVTRSSAVFCVVTPSYLEKALRFGRKYCLDIQDRL